LKFELLAPAAGKKKKTLASIHREGLKKRKEKKRHGMELKLEAWSFLWQQPPLFKGSLETLKIKFAPK
jgi:hypothetical protein